MNYEEFMSALKNVEKLTAENNDLREKLSQKTILVRNLQDEKLKIEREWNKAKETISESAVVMGLNSQIAESDELVSDLYKKIELDSALIVAKDSEMEENKIALAKIASVYYTMLGHENKISITDYSQAIGEILHTTEAFKDQRERNIVFPIQKTNNHEKIKSCNQTSSSSSPRPPPELPIEEFSSPKIIPPQQPKKVPDFSRPLTINRTNQLNSDQTVVEPSVNSDQTIVESSVNSDNTETVNTSVKNIEYDDFIRDVEIIKVSSTGNRNIAVAKKEPAEPEGIFARWFGSKKK